MVLSDTVIVGTTVACMLGLSTLMMVLSFEAPHHGAVMSNDETTLASDDFCDSLYIQNVRPFRFFVGSSDSAFSCPWPSENTAFRVSLAALGLGATCARCYLSYRNWRVWLQASAWLEALAAACWLSVATLDADALRSGDALCRKNFKVEAAGSHYHLLVIDKTKLQCASSPLAWLVFGDFSMLLVCLASSYVWYRYAAPQEKKLTMLADPFLSGAGANPLMQSDSNAPSTVEDGSSSNSAAPAWAYEPTSTVMH